MTKLLQQALDALIESRDDVDLCYAGVKAARLSFRQERQLGFYEEQLVKHDAAIEGLKQALAQQEPNPWSEAVIDQLVTLFIYVKEHDTDPRKAVKDLLGISNSIALDPQVSSDAQALIDRGRREAQQEQPAQEPLAVVPRTMILEDADLRFLHGLSQPDEEDGSFSPIALTVGDGHAGHGIYASLSEYPEEGADIICKFAAPTQPASVDAYVGAREDAAIWKKRALEAEELNRKFIADVNGPTYLGEPAHQEQPAQEASATWTEMVVANLVREGVNKHRARELAAHFLTLPTQQALSDEDVLLRLHVLMNLEVIRYPSTILDVWRACEAHCRGGAAS